ncbi:AF4/FMR2 family member 1 [Microtus ochrogaster]|uniref:AF4/FMR2 family member 1 n=1 Tax=Microtus ochrogaster TaxID=79684 RepID=A0A8J6L257_MICOH|nr:AF4/FMR2 family member 1 [Microtus ochrogaster]
MSTFHRLPLIAFKDSSENSNLLRIREKERGNQEAHPEKEVFAEKMPLFGEPYKTTQRDELSHQIQNILGDYEVMKELWRSTSCTRCPNGSEDSRGKPKYPLFHDRESLASNSCCAHIYHKLFCTSSAPGSPFVGNISHSSKMAPPRMEPVPSLHAKNYGPPNKQHLTGDRLSQEGHSSNHKKCDRRADGDSAPGKKLSPLISPVSHLSPVHSRLQRTRKVYSSSSTSNKGYCADTSSKDLKVKVQDTETTLDTSVVITRLGVASSQTFPPPPLPSESVAMQQKPMTCIWPTDGQNQAPSVSLGLKPPLEDNGQQSFEKLDVKVPAKAKLTRLKISSQSESVEQLFSNEVRCIEEILKEMSHSWLPPLTAEHTPSKAKTKYTPSTAKTKHTPSTAKTKHTPSKAKTKHTPSTAKTKHTPSMAKTKPTPSTAKSSRSPFPTKEPLPNSSATQSQNQYDPPSKIYPNSQQGTSILWEDLQLSDSEESDIEQTAEKLPSLSAPPSAPQILPKPVVSAHSSSAKSENKGENRNTDQLHPEFKDSPPKSSSKGIQDPTEGPQPEERRCQKSPAQQESPPQQTIETKQPRKPAKGSGQAEHQSPLQVESKPGPLPSESKKQTSKDKPEMKAKDREHKPEARMPNHQAAEPAPKEKRKHKGSPAPSKVPSGPQPPKNKAQNRNSFTPPHSGRGCSGGSNGRSSDCQQTANVQEDGQKRDTELLSPLRDSPPPTSLVVKINLDHLTQILQPLGKSGSPRKAEDRQPPADKKQDSEKRDCNGSSRLSKKRKGSNSEKDRASKKIRREKDVQSSSSSHTESSKTKTSKPSSRVLK